MGTTFKYIGPVVGLALALSAPASAQAPDQQPRSPGAPPSTQRPATPPASQAPDQQRPDAAGQTARGEIVSVDSDGKMLTIKMADGTEQKVRYSDDTKVTGERGGLAGLSKMSGRQVVVHFNNQSANRVASEIQIQAAGARPNATPNTTPSTRPGDRPDSTRPDSTRPEGARPDGARPDGAGDKPGGAGAPGGDKPDADK
jgi:hypothetical protein